MNIDELETAGPKKARVEIIPLIDVIFFLLATFVLFTLSLHRLRSLEADLPGGDAIGRIETETVFIRAAVGDAIFWKLGTKGVAEPITAPELGPKLAQYRRGTAAPRVMIQSDGKARLGAAVMILDEVRRAGIKQVAIETKVTHSPD